MCFSATASFVAGAALVPAGIYAVQRSAKHNKKLLLLSFLPLFFGIQQLIEGMIWVSSINNNFAAVDFFSMGYMFFTWFMWPVWIPLSTFPLEPCKRKYLFLAFASIGGMLGALQYVPYFAHDDWLNVVIMENAIAYQGKILFDYIMQRDITNILYLIVIFTPLFASTDKRMKIFGGLLSLSVAITFFFFRYAYISAFCFGAGVLSLYIVYIVIKDTKYKEKQKCT